MIDVKKIIIKNIDILNIFLINVFLILLNPATYTMWTDRDLVRAKSNIFEPLGAELSFYTGDRIPGGLLNFIWGLGLKIYDSPIAILAIQSILISISLTFLYITLNKKYSIISNIIIIILLNLGINEYVGGLWNPSMAAPFIILSYSFLLKGIWEDEKNYKWAYLNVFFAMQMHLSSTLLLVILLIITIIKKIKLKEVMYILLFFIINYAYYFLYEYNNHFSNSQSLIYQLKTLLNNYKIIFFSIFILIITYKLKMKHMINIIYALLILITLSLRFNSVEKVEVNQNLINILNGIHNVSELSKNCKNKEFKCLNLNNDYNNLNMIHINEAKYGLSEQFRNLSTIQNELHINTVNMWNDEDGRYSTLHMVVFLKYKKIIYTEDGYLKPLWNITNLKSITSYHYNDFKIPFFIILMLYLILIYMSYNKDEFKNSEDIILIILTGLVINLIVFGSAFSLLLTESHKRYLLISMISNVLLIGILIEYLKNKYRFKINLNDKFKIIVLIVLILGIVIKINSVLIINKTEYLIDKINENINIPKEKIYNNLILINKNNQIVLTNKTLDYKYNYLDVEEEKCYIASEVKLNKDKINEIYSKPYNMCVGEDCLNNKNPKSLEYNAINMTNHQYESINNYKYITHINDKLTDNNLYIYEVNFKEKISCPSSYHNRYILSDIDKKEKSLYDDKNNVVNTYIENNQQITIIKNKTINNYFTYAFIINRKNGTLRLESHQLKGLSYNLGFFYSYTMYNIKIKFKNEEFKFNDILGINGNIKPLLLKNAEIKKLNKNDYIYVQYSIYNKYLNNEQIVYKDKISVE